MKKISFLLSCFFSLSLFAQTTYLHCGKVFDSKTGKIKKEMTLIVEGDKIIAVEKGYVVPVAGATAIDLKSKTVYPGFIDMHVHLKAKVTLHVISTVIV